IGWGGLALCLTLEAIYKLGVGSFAGAVLGFATMLVARFLAESGDTLEMLQAVLDTNFWLATHVTCVTLGYVATFVSGLIAIVYIVGGVFTTGMRGESGKQVAGMMYGTICFATLLSFTGTVLGGIWADQSWRRLWGWDRKENGAVLIVIWTALILHARWGGLIKPRGMAVLAVFGNMVTAWSWFGTNQLGIGLHAYGFDNRLATGCALFWVSQLLIAGLGMVPLRFWASFDPNIPAKAKKASQLRDPRAVGRVRPRSHRLHALAPPAGERRRRVPGTPARPQPSRPVPARPLPRVAARRRRGRRHLHPPEAQPPQLPALARNRAHRVPRIHPRIAGRGPGRAIRPARDQA